jgi:hypothetical protein
MKERAALSGRLRSFGSVTSQGTVAKYLSEEGLGERARRCRWKFYKRLEEPEEENKTGTMSPCLPV